jgi:hypothetical protein
MLNEEEIEISLYTKANILRVYKKVFWGKNLYTKEVDIILDTKGIL